MLNKIFNNTFLSARQGQESYFFIIVLVVIKEFLIALVISLKISTLTFW